MKNVNIKKIYFPIGLILIMLNAFWWGYQKEGFYGDELYSYAFVCSTDEPSVNWGTEQEPYLNNWHSSEYFQDYFIITPEEAFDVIGVAKVIWGDDHPPMFDEVLELAISLFSQNRFSKWIGLSINFFFFFFSLIALYAIGKEIFQSSSWALIVMCAYGFSIGAVSNVVFIRMYMMLTFATLILTYLNIKILKNKSFVFEKISGVKHYYIFLSFIIIFGMTTQYYFSVYCGFLSMAVFLYLFLYKEFKMLTKYVLSVGAGLIGTALIWPETYNDIFREDRAKQAFIDVASKSSFREQLGKYLNIFNEEIFSGLLWLVIIAIVAMALGLVILRAMNRGSHKNINEKKELNSHYIIIISLSCLLYAIMIARIAPMQVDRYVFNVFPLIILSTVYFLKNLADRLVSILNINLRYIVPISITTVGAFIIVWGYLTVGVNYIYKGDSIKAEKMYQNTDIPVVMVTNDNRRYFSCVNSYYVRFAKQTYPVKFEEIEKAYNEIKNMETESKETIVFVDKQIEDSMVVLERLIPAIGEGANIDYWFDTEEGKVYHIYL